MRWRLVLVGAFSVAVGALVVSVAVVAGYGLQSQAAMCAGDTWAIHRIVMSWASMGDPLVLASLTILAVVWATRRAPGREIQHSLAIAVGAVAIRYVLSASFILWSIWFVNAAQTRVHTPYWGAWLAPSVTDIVAGPMVALVTSAMVMAWRRVAEGRRPTSVSGPLRRE